MLSAAFCLFHPVLFLFPPIVEHVSLSVLSIFPKLVWDPFPDPSSVISLPLILLCPGKQSSLTALSLARLFSVRFEFLVFLQPHIFVSKTRGAATLFPSARPELSWHTDPEDYLFSDLRFRQVPFVKSMCVRDCPITRQPNFIVIPILSARKTDLLLLFERIGLSHFFWGHP